ncbi:hypothetical protein TNCV_888211 [Trichonephila clavipes]|nr:hypothetical protein TNCV_888211 [Trichonephila clavipes]
MATGSSLTQNHSRSQSEIQGDLHKSLEDQVITFHDFKKIEFKLNVLCNLITADIDAPPEELQLELIDLKSGHSVKKMFNAIQWRTQGITGSAALPP